MKSLDDLKAIREKAHREMDLRKEASGYKVVVGMATCGIAAGAKPVMSAFVDLVNKEGLSNVTVTQTGCIGICRLEPVVEIFNPDGEKYTYVKMDAEKALRVFGSHLKENKPVTEYLIGSNE